MFYSSLLIRMVGEWSGDIALWSAIGSACYLCALGFGVFLSEKRPQNNVENEIAPLELGHALLGVLAIFGLYLWHMVYRIYVYDQGVLVGIGEPSQVWIFGAGSQALLILLGLLSGYEFGLMNHLALRKRLRDVQYLLATYHLGGLVASLAFLCLTAPYFEACHQALAVGLFHWVLAGLWQLRVGSREQVLRWSRMNILCLVSLLSLVFIQENVQLTQLHLKNFYYNKMTWEIDGQAQVTYFRPLGLFTFIERAEALPPIDHYRGLYQTIDIVPDLAVDIHGRETDRYVAGKLSVPGPRQALKSWSMFMDGHFQIHSVYEQPYHEVMGHIPGSLIRKIPHKVLIVGGGDGLLAREVLRAADFTKESVHIDLIDIDGLILKLAREEPRMVALNRGALRDPRVKIIEQDAFQALRRSQESYDAIYMDVLFPFNLESSRLYSQEFFAILAQKLAPDGYLSLLSPIDFDGTHESQQLKILEALTSTLSAAGFVQTILYGEERHSFLMVRKVEGELSTVAAMQTSLAAALLRDLTSLQRYQSIDMEHKKTLVNSLLKPKFFGLKDPFF